MQSGLALPHVPGIPRYVLFLATPFAVILARTYCGRVGRLWIAALILYGAIGSWALLPNASARDTARRTLAQGLEEHGVRFCYTDFSMAPIINFLSEGNVTCTAKLGPTTSEYFFEHRRAVEGATAAAFVPINTTAAAKIERRLKNLGVTYERIDLTKPVILHLSRKVDPEELFPHRDFPWR